MSVKWVKVRKHPRAINGTTILVKDHHRLVETSARRNSRHSTLCPYCDAQIRSVRMPNGGFVHFETARGLSRIKPPCFTIGDGLSNKHPDGMDDLFDGDDAG